MRCTIPLCALFATRALAQSGTFGWFDPGISTSTPAAIDAATAAGRHPNITHQVDFKRPWDGTLQDWAWRINVTQVAVPNDVDDFGQSSADHSDDLYVINAQWQLDWPGANYGSGKSLPSNLADGNNTLYMNAAIISFPSHITKHWTIPSDGNCSSILGADCVENLYLGVSEGPSTRTELFSAPPCQSVFGSSNAGTPEIHGTTIRWDSPDTFTSNDTLYYYTSPTFTQGNNTAYDLTTKALHFFTMNFGSLALETPVLQPIVLCQIVDSSSAGAPFARVSAASWLIVAVATLLAVI